MVRADLRRARHAERDDQALHRAGSPGSHPRTRFGVHEWHADAAAPRHSFTIPGVLRDGAADRAVRFRRIGGACQIPATWRGDRTMTAETLPLWVTIPGTFLLVVAGMATLIGSFGLLRLRDFFSRMHGPSMTNTVGGGATLIASMLVSSALAGRPILHELLITLFVSMSAPVTAIMLLQAALYRNKARGGGDVTGNGNRA